MNLTTRVPCTFYAITLLAFGIAQFIFGDFIAGRAPLWPSWLPGQYVFAYGTGALLLATGVAVIVHWKPTMGLIVVGIVILLWAGLRNIYEVLVHLDYGFLLTNTGKALTLGSGAFLVASFFTSHEQNSNLNIRVNKLASLCQYCTGFFLLVSGIQHFLFADFVKFLIPAWIPGSLFWTYFAGVALAAAGIGLLTNIKAHLAATLAAYMVFTWLILLHIPRAIGTPDQNEWTAVFEALAVSGILFLLSQKLKPFK